MMHTFLKKLLSTSSYRKRRPVSKLSSVVFSTRCSVQVRQPDGWRKFRSNGVRQPDYVATFEPDHVLIGYRWQNPIRSLVISAGSPSAVNHS